jgi:DNA-binding NtrC family response regulator
LGPWGELLDEPLVAARAEIADRFERTYLERLLRKTNGRLRDVAKFAHVDERTLYARMKRHGLSKEQFRL